MISWRNDAPTNATSGGGSLPPAPRASSALAARSTGVGPATFAGQWARRFASVVSALAVSTPVSTPGCSSAAASAAPVLRRGLGKAAGSRDHHLPATRAARAGWLAGDPPQATTEPTLGDAATNELPASRLIFSDRRPASRQHGLCNTINPDVCTHTIDEYDLIINIKTTRQDPKRAKPSEIQGLCHPCHAIKTQAEAKAGMNRQKRPPSPHPELAGLVEEPPLADRCSLADRCRVSGW